MQGFASAPRAVGTKTKYRTPDDDIGGTARNNMMHDKRVVRGNTYASLVTAQEDPAEVQKQREAQRRRLMRANQTVKRAGTPEAVPGRKHMDIQTDTYLEELTERTVEFEAETQTDFLLDRPPSPLYMPTKIGVDVETQIEEGELFDFDIECEPVLEVLVGKTLEQSMMEVLEEEELESLRRHQEDFEKRRNAELLEVQRIEIAEQRRNDEMERRTQQQAAQKERDLTLMRKVVSRSIANAHLGSLKDRALAHLLDAGVFADSVELGVESQFMPDLLKMVSQQMRQQATDRQLFDEVGQAVVADSLATHGKKLEVEQRRLKALDEAERKYREELAEERAKREENTKRILREQTKMKKFDAKVKQPPKITSYVIRSFDGEEVTLDDGRKVRDLGDGSLKDDLLAMMGDMKGGIGERAVCNIATDPDFVPPDDADPDANIAWGSKIQAVKKFRVNNFALEVIEAKGMRAHPVDPYVVIRDVKGSVGEEKRTEVVQQTTTPEWRQSFDLTSTFKLGALLFEVYDANPDNKTESGADELLLKCKLPVDMLYDSAKQTGADQEVVIDTWLDSVKNDPGAGASQGQLHVIARATFKIPIVYPGVVLDLPEQFKIGLAWDFLNDDNPVDLDASIVALNSEEKIEDQIWFQKLEGCNGAVSHSGDDRSGDGDGDDETISFDLSKMPDAVEKCAICINSYDEHNLNECVKFAYIRLIINDTTHGFFSMGEGWIPKCTGIFFASIRKRPDGWKFITTAAQANGATVEQSLPHILAHGKKHLGW
mmetsp:Transcript_113538/g.321537  ORF Transcript_113538/g.321537 Transcript_113538/m.321537 type:complete len:773 (-) Transcript_113538:43-2361(-)